MSESAKHINNNFYHVFSWVILCKAPRSYKGRRNLEAPHMALLQPTLNEKKILT